MGARIGLIVPSSNTVAEVDFYKCVPDGATVHTARMYLEETTPEGEAVMLDEHLQPAVRDLATLHPDVVVFGCTSAGALRGNAYEANLIAQLTRQSQAKTISVAASVRRAIEKRGARRVGVVTPYVPALNERIAASLEADGFEVVDIRGLGLTENFAIASVEPDQIVEFASESFNGRDIDLLFVSCTNFRAVDARERIERTLGVPVVTSNQAALEAVVEHLDA